MNPDWRQVPTPCYVLDEAALERNLRRLADVQERAGCRILLALKGFAFFPVFPLARRYLAGATASSLHETRLAAEEFGGEVHVCAPAYADDEFPELLARADHIVFNSFAQWRRFKPRVAEAGRPVACGIRVNPEHSEVRTAAYDPCRPGSRLGVTRAAFDARGLDGIDGLHFHALCELNADALERVLAAFESRFGEFLSRMAWVNFGGGHLITREDYDVDRLCRIVADFRARHGVTVYLEPGEAVALNAGVLVARVLDIVRNEKSIAILDTSAAAHMPDVLEMPYRPAVAGAGAPGEFAHTYELAGVTCLAGDVIGEYSFREPLEVGARLVFMDMAHYTVVKNNTFNGVRLPSLAVWSPGKGELRVVREFGYEDFKARLGPAG
ncbi:MAG: carboxynorspermidine decarboxylase [Lentisphaerae bacterium]|nr:carboxynorspermidine decarboxylase [Lentisphaerota bacterium]